MSDTVVKYDAGIIRAVRKLNILRRDVFLERANKKEILAGIDEAIVEVTFNNSRRNIEVKEMRERLKK